MAKKTAKRIRRTGKLSPKESARDREIRRKVTEEFPPHQAESDSKREEPKGKEAARGKN